VAQSGNVVSVYSGQGKLISSAAVSGEVRLGALQDADGDKIDDLLLAGRVKDELQVLFLRGDGKTIRRFDLKATDITPLDAKQSNNFGAAIYGLRDIDGDGGEEAVIALSTGYDLMPRGVLALAAATGKIKWYYPVGPGITQVLMQDINRDASPDVLAMGYSLGNKNIAPDRSHDFASFLYSLAGRGNRNWSLKMPVYHSGARIAVQDIDRDNTEEIVFSGYTAWQYRDTDVGLLAAINGLSGQIENKVEAAKSFDDKGLVVTNSVGTGLAEIAVGGREGIVRKYDHQLKPLAAYTSTGAVSVMAGNDFTRTSKPDFFALTDDNVLLVLNNALKPIAGYEYPSGGREAAVLVSDLIPGGSNELVLVADRAYVLTAATRPEEQFETGYKFLEDLPTGQLADLKRQGVAVALLTIKNKTGREARFRVRHELSKFGEEEEEIVSVPAGLTRELSLFPEFNLEKRLTSQKSSKYSINIAQALPDGSYRKVSSRKFKLRVHPANRFFPVLEDASGKKLDLLATLVNWVDPQSPEVGEIVDAASRLGREENPRVNIVGAQPLTAFRGIKDTRTLEEKDKDYLAQIGLAYKALQKLYAPTYKSTPLVLTYRAGVSQIVQTPAETLRKSGNCIDNSVLFASILERMEFRPLLALLLDEGHVIVGWSVEGPSADGAPAHKYRFLGPNKFSPEIGFEKVLTAGQDWTANPILKPFLSAPAAFKDGIYSSEPGDVLILDVTGLKQDKVD